MMSTIKNIIKTVFPGSRQLYERIRKRMGYSDAHWVRQVMDAETLKLVSEIHPARMKVLEISGNKWGASGMFERYTSIDYPEYDVCKGPLDVKFDLIIAEQIFEHLAWPYRAGKNIHAMLNPGGYFLLTTPFLLKVHNYPIDCSRWTETGIRYFLAECGFPLESIRSGSWGNRACINANFKGWINYNKWIHSLANEPDFPAVVWAICRKAEGNGDAEKAAS